MLLLFLRTRDHHRQGRQAATAQRGSHADITTGQFLRKAAECHLGQFRAAEALGHVHAAQAHFNSLVIDGHGEFTGLVILCGHGDHLVVHEVAHHFLQAQSILI